MAIKTNTTTKYFVHYDLYRISLYTFYEQYNRYRLLWCQDVSESCFAVIRNTVIGADSCTTRDSYRPQAWKRVYEWLQMAGINMHIYSSKRQKCLQHYCKSDFYRCHSNSTFYSSISSSLALWTYSRRLVMRFMLVWYGSGFAEKKRMLFGLLCSYMRAHLYKAIKPKNIQLSLHNVQLQEPKKSFCFVFGV